MNDQQLLRYSRHILLNEIGIEGPQRLLDATALIIGLGGLGAAAALYLAASGVGKLILCDHDTVDFSTDRPKVYDFRVDLAIWAMPAGGGTEKEWTSPRSEER